MKNENNKVKNTVPTLPTPAVNQKKKPFFLSWPMLCCFLAAYIICDLIFTVHTSRFHFIELFCQDKTEEKDKIISDNFVFLGDSITEGYHLEEFYEDMHVVNSGKSGYQTTDILKNLDEMVYQYNPSKVLLLIGINDLYEGRSVNDIIDNMEEIIVKIKEKRPYAELYVLSIYPVNQSDDEKINHKQVKNRDNKDIDAINDAVKDICTSQKITYIDVASKLKDENGELKLKYTSDGLHLNNLGYLRITTILLPYLKEA